MVPFITFRMLPLIKQLTPQAMTVTQLAESFGEAPNKLHYHVRELERVGLLKMVETREKGAILEKYYRTIARNINMPKNLLSGVPPDEAVAMLNEVIQPFFQSIMRATEQMMRISPEDQSDHVSQFIVGHYWMTAEEFALVSKQVQALLQLYEEQRGIEHEHDSLSNRSFWRPGGVYRRGYAATYRIRLSIVNRSIVSIPQAWTTPQHWRHQFYPL